jgi:hypothetical protein
MVTECNASPTPLLAPAPVFRPCPLPHAEYHRAHPQAAATGWPPSLLPGLLLRILYDHRYYLRGVHHLEAAQEPGAKPFLWVQARFKSLEALCCKAVGRGQWELELAGCQEAQWSLLQCRPGLPCTLATIGASPPATHSCCPLLPTLLQSPDGEAAEALRRIPLSSVSNTSSLHDDPKWELLGAGEVAGLQACMKQRGQALPLAEVSGSSRQQHMRACRVCCACLCACMRACVRAGLPLSGDG